MSLVKLKESIQEVIVFLRSLGEFRIPAVIERRRKELLQNLLELHGEPACRDIPKSLEESAEEKAEEKKKEKGKEKEKEKIAAAKPLRAGSVEKKEKSPEPEKEESPVKSPTRRLNKRDSKNVLSLIGNFEHIQKAAKEEEIAETPKRLVQLKKVDKPKDFPDEKKEEETKEEPNKNEQPKEETKVEVKEPTPTPEEKTPDKNDQTLKTDDQNQLKAERRLSGASIDSHDIGDEEDRGEEKGKKKKKKKLDIFKRKRDKSPAPVAAEAATNGEENDGDKSTVSEGEETHPPEPQEEGVKLSMTLELKSKTAFKSKWTKHDVKLKDSSLYVGGKETNLSGCVVTTTDSGFEVAHPENKKIHLIFKVEGDEAKEQWVNVLNETIKECTPEEEEKAETEENGKAAEDVPSISIEEPPPEEQSTPVKKRKESKAPSLKPQSQRKLPDHGVEMKGYVHRKKAAGLGKAWEKTYCVLTYQAVYFTTMEDNKEYTHMFPLSTEVKGSVSPKKGHDKSSQGLVLKVGKKSEHLSVESKSEFDQWMSALERVLGIGGVEELLSEDEDSTINEIPEDVGGEELYEELDIDAPPPVPASPRPARALPEPEDDIIIDEDIYEDTTDYQFDNEDLPTPYQEQAPSLPNRNPSKETSSPAPTLPPRNEPAVPLPALPPRNSPATARKNEPATKSVVPGPSLKKAPAPPPPAAEPEDEELYDDVVTTNKDDEIQETYDDVVVPSGVNGVEEELYDDVVTATTPQPTAAEPITEEFYEDMAPGVQTPEQEDYVVMEPGSQDEVEQELYVDVEEPSASLKVNSQSKSPSPKPQKSTHTFSRMFGSKAKQQLHSGAVSYKSPKKSSKFEDKWAVIEGNTLQIFKTSSDKRSQEKLTLSDCGLDSGSSEAGAGPFAFRLSKGDKVHHFSVKSQEEMQGWVDVLKGLTKYAAVAMTQQQAQEGFIYQTTEDHIADTDDELTFKKGTLLKLINKESDETWFGQIGNEAQVFEGKKGKFPSSKVSFLSDGVYY